MLGEYLNAVIYQVEKSEFGTEYLNPSADKEIDNSSIYDEETKKAILSIFFGARIHDAAVMIGISDRAMRDRFLAYCKHTNVEQFERIYERAVNQGYSTPPVELFQPSIFSFFSRDELPFGHSNTKLPPSAMETAIEGLEKAKKELSIARIKLNVVQGVSRVLSKSF